MLREEGVVEALNPDGRWGAVAGVDLVRVRQGEEVFLDGVVLLLEGLGCAGSADCAGEQGVAGKDYSGKNQA